MSAHSRTPRHGLARNTSAVPERYAAPVERAGAQRGRGLRIAVDILFAGVFVTLMTTATVEEVAHEWLGIAAFVLFTVHLVLNRRWWAGLLRGRWSALRVASTAAALGVMVCLLGQVASSLVLSEHAFSWLPAFPGASWARIVHLLCSYWGFVLAFVHAGFGLRRHLGRRTDTSRWLVRACGLVIVCAGAWSFVQLDVGTYLLLQSQFVFVDFSVPLSVRAVEYTLIGVGLACCSHAAGGALRSLGHRQGAVRGPRDLTIPRGQDRSMEN